MAAVANPIVVMKRYEMKYILSPEQTEFFKKKVVGHMKIDKFGLTSIASLYYDTPDYRLIRTSIDKPAFKEKLRLRSYGLATAESPVFLELKRKASGIVYKRRVQTVLPEVGRFFAGESELFENRLINRELNWFRDFYGDLRPACLIIYDRVAYFEPGGDLRLTIDFNPRYRTEALNLTSSMDGIPLRPEGDTVLEIKVQEAMPLWLAEILDDGEVDSTEIVDLQETLDFLQDINGVWRDLLTACMSHRIAGTQKSRPAGTGTANATFKSAHHSKL